MFLTKPVPLLLFTVVMMPCGLKAGLCSAVEQADDARNEFQVWGGYSAHSGGPISSTPDLKFAAAGFQYTRRCWAWQNFSVGINAGVMPMAIVSRPEVNALSSVIGTCVPDASGFCSGSVSVLGALFLPAHSTYGFAVTPLGFTVDFARHSRVYPFVQIDGGFVKSSERVPLSNAPDSSFNFLVDLGGGLKIRLSKLLALSAGYKFMHISNADTASYNPGIDNNVFFAGISLLK